MLLYFFPPRKDGQFLARDPVTGENGCMDIAPEDVNCLARLQTSCTDLDLTEDECDCPGQILITGDCSSFYSCFSRTRYDCEGNFPNPIKNTLSLVFALFIKTNTGVCSLSLLLENQHVDAEFDQSFHCHDDDDDHEVLFSCANNDPDVSGWRGIKLGCKGQCSAETNPLGECGCERHYVRRNYFFKVETLSK